MLLELIIPAERRAVVQSLGHPRAGQWITGGNVSRAGKAVNEETALGLSAVWAATNKIAGTLAMFPCKLMQVHDDGARTPAKALPLYEVLKNEPNPEMDAYLFWEQQWSRWINWGNAFCEIERVGAQVVGLWPIHPSRVTPRRNPQTKRLEYVIRNNEGANSLLDASDVLNIVGHLSEDGVRGRGVIHYAIESIGAQLANRDFRASFFGNMARPGVVLEHPGTLGPEARENLRNEWNKVHEGVDNAGKVAVLWEGLQAKEWGFNAEQAEMIAGAQFEIAEVARWYDLPPHVLRDLTKSSFSNIDSEQRSLLVDSYAPRIVRVEMAGRRQLLTAEQKRQGYMLKFNTDAMLRGDPEKRANTFRTRLLHGNATQNDWLRAEDLPTLPPEIGDVRFMPQNVTTLDRIIEGQNVAQPGDEQPGDLQGEEAPQDDFEPAGPDPMPQAGRAVARAAREAVRRELERLAANAANAANRASKKPEKWLSWLDEFAGKQRELVEENLEAAIEVFLLATEDKRAARDTAHKLASAHVARFTELMLGAADGDPGQFTARVSGAAERLRGELPELETLSDE